MFETLVVEDILPGGPPLEIRLREAGRIEGLVHVPHEAAARFPQLIWVSIIDAEQPDERLFRFHVETESVSPVRLSHAIPILDRSVLVSIYTSKLQWTLSDPTVFRSGEAFDIGELQPDPE